MESILSKQILIPLLTALVLLWIYVPVIIKWKHGEEIQKSIKVLAVFASIGAIVLLGLIINNLLL